MTVEKRVLDNELRKKLAEMGGLGFSVNPDFTFVPKLYRKKEKDSDVYMLVKTAWPVFELHGKDGIESSKMEDGMGHMEYDDTTEIRRWIGKSGSKRLQILRDGVKGWKNFFDHNGDEIIFRENNGRVSDKALKLIPANIALELANAIIDRATLTPEELEGL